MDLFTILMTPVLYVYAWVLYNFSILAVGATNLRRPSKKRTGSPSVSMERLPFVSIVVALKDEEKVVDRLLRSLLRLDYPRERMQILIAEDGSTDKTVQICEEYVRRHPGQVRLLRKSTSNGKPSALNFALKYAKGEIVVVFDADSVPEPDALKMAVAYFRDPSVAAVQGRLCSINADENMLTKFVSHEEVVWCEAYLRGKDVLGLFVHLKGSCQFIRRDILVKLNGFDEEALTEDMELSVRLAEKGYRIRYAPDVRSWQENPSQVRRLFRQRTRWFRGTMEVALKCGRLITKPDRMRLDAELTLLGPFMLIASPVIYILTLYASFAAFNPDVLIRFLFRLSAIGASVVLAVCGITLACVSKPRRLANLLSLPFVYFYWGLHACIALYAALLILFRRPQKWLKTQKTGTIKTKELNL